MTLSSLVHQLSSMLSVVGGCKCSTQFPGRWSHPAEIAALRRYQRFLRGSCPRLEVCFRHGRHLLDERYDSPDFLVRHSDRAEARHAGHLDTVFDYPEQLWRLPVLCDVLEIWRIWEHAFRKLGPFHAGSSVTVQAPARAKCASAGLHRRDIVERIWWIVGCAPVDRGHSDVGQRPVDDARFRRCRRHAVKAAKEEYRGTDGKGDRQRADKSQDSHELSPRLSDNAELQ